MSEPQQIDKQALEWAQVIVGMGSEISPARVQKILAHAIREAVEAATQREKARCIKACKEFAEFAAQVNDPCGVEAAERIIEAIEGKVMGEPLTDATVDAYLEAHKDDPVDEAQLERIRKRFAEAIEKGEEQ